MKLKNVYIVEYSEPGNIEDYVDSVFFSDLKEAEHEFNKQFKEIKTDLDYYDDDVRLTLQHNGRVLRGYCVFDGKLEEM